jgi:hypothetical protein
MVLTKRQETAQRLTRELQSLGATVTNVMPLEEGKNLRFWVSDYKKKEVLQELKDAGYEPIFLKMEMQPDIRTYSMGLVSVFAVPIAAERQEIPQDRAIPKDTLAAPRAKTEADAIASAWYGKKR